MAPLFAPDGTAAEPVRALADAVPCIVWTCSADGEVTSLNRSWTHYTGQSAEDGLAHGIDEFLHPDDLRRVREAWQERLPGGAQAGRDFSFEYRLCGRTREYRWHLAHVVARRAPDGAVVEWVGTSADVHEQKVAQEALAASNARLQETGLALERTNRQLQEHAAELVRRTEAAEQARAEAARQRDVAAAANQAKAQFLAAMSHELRTPLNAIGGYVQLLDMGLHGPVTDEQQEALGRVTRAQQHLLGLINDILNYSKLESGRVEYDLQALDLRDVLAEVAPLAEPQLSARTLAFDVVLPDTVPLVWADREKLRQVLLNLLSNAGKFTDPGGRVLVDVAARQPRGPDRPTPAGDLRPGAVDGHANEVFLRVTDTGIGIARDRQDVIFEPFVQVRANLGRLHEGTGLGLAISRDLARGMGGDLRVRSAPRLGSTFTLTLRRVYGPDGRPTDRRVGAERRLDDERRAPDDRRHDDAPAADRGRG